MVVPFGLYQRPKDKIVFECRAEVAQLVEQWTENPCVGGSSPPLGTIASGLIEANKISAWIQASLLAVGVS